MRTLAAVSVALVAASCAGDGERAAAEVARIVDGDTIVLAGGEHVRLVQIDAPEAAEGECYGDRATRVLERLLPPGSSVELEADGRLDDADRFGRLLRYVHVGETNVNLELVARGAAGPYFFDGERGRYADDLLDRARDARSGRRGLWRACPGATLDPGRALETGGG